MILALIGIFFGGFMLGIKVSSTEPIAPLDTATLEALKAVVEERNATIALHPGW